VCAVAGGVLTYLYVVVVMIRTTLYFFIGTGRQAEKNIYNKKAQKITVHFVLYRIFTYVKI